MGLTVLDSAEILKVKRLDNDRLEFYVHFDDCKLALFFIKLSLVNKRLDEWVDQSRIDFDRIEYPHKKLPRDSSSASLSHLASVDTTVRLPVTTEETFDNESVCFYDVCLVYLFRIYLLAVV